MSMTSVVYLAAGDAATRKGAVALGISELLVPRPGRLGIFRPVVLPGRADGLIETIKARFGLEHSATGVTYEAVHRLIHPPVVSGGPVGRKTRGLEPVLRKEGGGSGQKPRAGR